MKMRLLLILVSIVLAAGLASASRIAYEPFTGTDGVDLDTLGSGSGWSGNWTRSTGLFQYSDPGNTFDTLDTADQKALFLGSGGSTSRYNRSLVSAVTVDGSNLEAWAGALVEIGSGDGDVNTGRGIGVELTHGGTPVVGFGKRLNSSFGVGTSMSDNWVNSSVGADSVGVRFLAVKLAFDGADTIATVYVATDGDTIDITDPTTFTGTATITITGPLTFDGVNLYGYHSLTTSNAIDEIQVADTYADFVAIQTDMANSPNPEDAAVSVNVSTNLSWSAPTNYTATGYDVYWGTDPVIANNPKVVDNQLVTTYAPPADLAWETTYYWAVDSYDGGASYLGDTWSFTTQSEEEHVLACYASSQSTLANADVTMIYKEFMFNDFPHSSYATVSFTGGYIGLASLTSSEGPHINFSIWDADTQNPGYLLESSSIGVPDNHRFDHEGFGYHAELDYHWQLGVRYKILVKVERSGSDSIWSAFFNKASSDGWHLCGRIYMPNDSRSPGNPGGFLEHVGTTNPDSLRSASFDPGWSYSDSSGWVACDALNYTNKDVNASNAVQIDDNTVEIMIQRGLTSDWNDGHIFSVTPRRTTAPEDPDSGSNNAPVFDSEPFSLKDAYVGFGYSGKIYANYNISDPDGDHLTWSIDSGPSWLSVSSDGTLSGYPSSGDAGWNSWTIRVEDPSSDYALGQLDIFVVDGTGGDVLESFDGTAGDDITVHTTGQNWSSSWGTDSGQAAITSSGLSFGTNLPGDGLAVTNEVAGTGVIGQHTRAMPGSLGADSINTELWLTMLLDLEGAAIGNRTTLDLRSGGGTVISFGKGVNTRMGVDAGTWVNALDSGSSSVSNYNALTLLTLQLKYNGVDTDVTIYVDQDPAGTDITDPANFTYSASTTYTGPVSFDNVRLNFSKGDTQLSVVDEIIISTTYPFGAPDTTPPTPDPMTFATAPYATGTTTISMMATTATDASGVEYYFTCTAGGGNDSGWQASSTYEDTGLAPSTQHTYTVTARDLSVNQNTTAASSSASATTDSIPPELPWSDGFESGDLATGGWSISGAVSVEDVSYTGAYAARTNRAAWLEKANSTAGFTNIHVKYARKTADLDSGEYLNVEWSTNGTDWNLLEQTADTAWAYKDMVCSTGADNNSGFRIRFSSTAGNREYAYIDDVEITGTAGSGEPDTTAPTPDPMTFATVPYATGSSSISMTATTATDPSGVEYFFTCTAGGGNDSGWQDSTTYEDTGLTPETQYTYTVTARDKSAAQNTTAASSGASATTNAAGATPAAPGDLSATAVATTQIDLSWTDNASNETGFKIERSTRTNGSFAQIATVGQDVTVYSDTTVRKGTTYFYRVRATNADGDSAYSNEANATTPRK